MEEEALPADRGRAAAGAAQAAGAAASGRRADAAARQAAALLAHEDGGLRGAQRQVRVLHGGDVRRPRGGLPRAPGPGLERRDHAADGAVQEPASHPGRQVHAPQAAAPGPAAAAAAGAAARGPAAASAAAAAAEAGAPLPQRLQLRVAARGRPASSGGIAIMIPFGQVEIQLVTVSGGSKRANSWKALQQMYLKTLQSQLIVCRLVSRCQKGRGMISSLEDFYGYFRTRLKNKNIRSFGKLTLLQHDIP